MIFILIFCIAAVLLFGSTLLFGPPYLPTLRKQVDLSIKLLDLKPGKKLFELGSGDGRMLAAAAKNGIKCVGVEINPLLVMYSRIRCRKYKNSVNVLWNNYWRVSLASADAIYVFGLGKYMAKLDKKIVQEIKHPVKVVSFAFSFPEREPEKIVDGLMIYTFKPEAT
jgi:SAM-dependent methyltransferase